MCPLIRINIRTKFNYQFRLKRVRPISSLSAGEAIKCYECNSHNDSRCAMDIPPESLQKDCAEHTEGSKYTMCRKITQSIDFEVNGRKRFRNCDPNREPAGAGPARGPTLAAGIPWQRISHTSFRLYSRRGDSIAFAARVRRSRSRHRQATGPRKIPAEKSRRFPLRFRALASDAVAPG